MSPRGSSTVWPRRALTALLLVVVPAALVAVPATGTIEGGPADASDVSLSSFDAEDGRPPTRAERVRSLTAGALEASIAPSTLFDVALEDPSAVALDATRIRALLRGASDAGEPRAVGPDAAVPFRRAAWDALLDAERARLAFYSLPAERRSELLEEHARRVALAQPEETAEERRQREAQEERERALAAAQRARSEAERLVAEELARLIGIGQSLEAASRKQEAERAEIAQRKDAVLGWQRRVREAKAAGPAEADAAYDALRKALRATRDELDASLAEIDTPAEIADLGPDPLSDIPDSIDVRVPREKRRELVPLLARLQEGERELRAERLAQLVSESDALNRERLGLMDSLSTEKRATVTGFGDGAWDQGRSEIRQLTLLARYHRFVAGQWLKALRGPGDAVGTTVWRALRFFVPTSLVVFLFVSWRRRARGVLGAVQTRLEEDDRAARATMPSGSLRALRFLRAVRAPVEGLLLLAAIFWLVPDTTKELLEVWLVGTIVAASLAGRLVVTTINAGFTAPASRGLSLAPVGVLDPDVLRLRSLRLIGRVVVLVVLVLVISARLVGKGAIYSWVLSTCWLFAVPVSLVLVRWWRPIVFARLEAARKKTPLQTWALARRRGWMSFPAATLAATHLFATATVRAVRTWVTSFDLARRAAAYLFRRELDKLEKDRDVVDDVPLPRAIRDALAPTEPPTLWVPTTADEELDGLARKMVEGRGGVVAIVAERGGGKSSILKRLAEGAEAARPLRCGREDTDLERLRLRLARETDLPADASLAEIGARIDASAAPRPMLFDDAHASVRMVVGGLSQFDALMRMARAHSRHAVWVFAFDESVWKFLSRARGIRPLFDDVLLLDRWSEERIGELIDARSRSAGLEASFDGLLDELPKGADEIDRQDALRERRIGFYRLLWDYARGNPGVALHAWRSTIVLDGDGAAHVRHLRTPGSSELDALPYPTLFVLRAALQLAPTTAAEIVRATQLTPMEVSDAIRYAVAHGYLSEGDGGIDLTWDWYRPITVALERRHLLALR